MTDSAEALHRTITRLEASLKSLKHQAAQLQSTIDAQATIIADTTNQLRQAQALVSSKEEANGVLRALADRQRDQIDELKLELEAINGEI